MGESPDNLEIAEVRKSLHAKIDRLGMEGLASLNEMVLAVELKELRRELDAGFDQDRQNGGISFEKVENAIALHRVRRPYLQ